MNNKIALIPHKTPVAIKEQLQGLPIIWDTSLKIPETIIIHIHNSIHQLINIIQSTDFRKKMQSLCADNILSPFLTDSCLPLSTDFVSFDMHITTDHHIKFIELSAFPPGMAFTAGELSPHEEIRYNYRQTLLKLVNDYSSIAIVDHDLPHQLFKSEFDWLINLLKSAGKKAKIVEASNIIVKDGTIIAEKTPIDFIINRLTLKDYLEQPNLFHGLAVSMENPKSIATTYRDWAYTDKPCFVILQQNDIYNGVSHIPKTDMVSSFKDIDEINAKYPPKKRILKPYPSHRGIGTLIKPTRSMIEKAIHTDYGNNLLVQELVPTMKLADGRRFDIRAHMVGGQIMAILARIYYGAKTNLSQQNSGLVPVIY